YLRDKTVRRLNRHRPPERRLHFRSKFRLARDILESLKPWLPSGWTIYVQFDSWYASEGLLRYIHRQGWYAVCALKSNRKFSGQRLSQFKATLRHKRSTRVRVTAADGTTTTYYVRDTVGRLSKVPFEVRVMFSKRHPRARSWAYFASTDLARTVVETLRGYSGRWSCEINHPHYVRTNSLYCEPTAHRYPFSDSASLTFCRPRPPAHRSTRRQIAS